MRSRNQKPKFSDGWCFATINNRLAEIHFAPKSGIWAYAYVDRKEFSKREQNMIDADIKKFQFSYRNKRFRDKQPGTTSPLGTPPFTTPHKAH